MAPFLLSLLEQTTFSANGEAVLKQLKQDLNLSYKVAVKAWKTSDMAHIERKNGTNRLALKRLDKQERNSSAEKLKVAVKMRMPRIDLPDILMAVILSEACNVGLTPVAKETIEALKIDRLRYVDQYYLRLSTITEANNKLVAAYHLAFGGVEIWPHLMLSSLKQERNLYMAVVIPNIMDLVRELVSIILFWIPILGSMV